MTPIRFLARSGNFVVQHADNTLSFHAKDGKTIEVLSPNGSTYSQLGLREVEPGRHRALFNSLDPSTYEDPFVLVNQAGKFVNRSEAERMKYGTNSPAEFVANGGKEGEGPSGYDQYEARITAQINEALASQNVKPPPAPPKEENMQSMWQKFVAWMNGK